MQFFLQRVVEEHSKTDEDGTQPDLTEGKSGHFTDHLEADQEGGFELAVGRREIDVKKRIDHRMLPHSEFSNGLRTRKCIAGCRGVIITSPDAHDREETENDKERKFII